MQQRQSKIKPTLEARAGIIHHIRTFFAENGYLEVTTPTRVPTLAPEAHIDAQESGSMFLHTSPELCMKRLLAAGYERIFQITGCFRRGERGTRHLPEFTMLEWYTAKSDYLHMMTQCEELVAFVAGKLAKDERIVYQGNEIRLERPWLKISVEEAFKKFASVSMRAALDADEFDLVVATELEPALVGLGPVFLYDYPLERGSLARKKESADSAVPLAERFELYMGGLELCNAFSELTDPNEQRRRFENENRLRGIAGKRPYPVPETFLQALAHMPQAAGNALGVDRLVMLLTDSATIDEVTAFTPEEL